MPACLPVGSGRETGLGRYPTAKIRLNSFRVVGRVRYETHTTVRGWSYKFTRDKPRLSRVWMETSLLEDVSVLHDVDFVHVLLSLLFSATACPSTSMSTPPSTAASRLPHPLVNSDGLYLHHLHNLHHLQSVQFTDIVTSPRRSAEEADHPARTHPCPEPHNTLKPRKDTRPRRVASYPNPGRVTTHTRAPPLDCGRVLHAQPRVERHVTPRKVRRTRAWSD